MMDESIDSILAEWRDALRNENPWGENDTRTAWINSGSILAYLDRLEAAWKREREASEDETLVRSCNTCKHFQRKRKWCRVHDYSPCDPSKLPLIWPNGPCPQWECKYNSRGGVEK